MMIQLFKYGSTYLIIGTCLMLVLDLMHRQVKHLIDEEFKEGYANWERLYIIFMWPVFLIGLVREIFKAK